MQSLRERAKVLLQSALEGTASDDELGELVQIFREQPNLADEAAPELLIHSLLQWQNDDISPELPGAGERPAAPLPTQLSKSDRFDSSRSRIDPLRRDARQDTHRRYRSFVPAAWVAAALLVLAGVGGLLRVFIADKHNGDEHFMVADLQNVVWQDGASPRNRTDVIGSKLHSLSGTYSLNLPAATVQVIGPAELTATSGSVVELNQGALKAHVKEHGQGFTVVTPQAEVIDRGTAFNVATTSTTATDVIVRSGIVDVRRRGAKGATRLTRGEAVRLDLSRSGIPMRLLQSRFDSNGTWLPDEDVVQGADSRDIDAVTNDVIAAVRDHIPIGEVQPYRCYQIIAGGLRDDCEAFADYDSQWNGLTSSGDLPRFLRGADYVKTFNAYRYNQGLQLQITLAVAADLYVFFDDRVPVPNWLALEFKETDVDIGLIETRVPDSSTRSSDSNVSERFDRVFSIWRRRVEVPGTVVLGDLGASGEDRLMYGVAAVPLWDMRD